MSTRASATNTSTKSNVSLLNSLTSGIKNQTTRRIVSIVIYLVIMAIIVAVIGIIMTLLYTRFVLNGKRYYCQYDSTTGAPTGSCQLLEESQAPKNCNAKGYLFGWWCAMMGSCRKPSSTSQYYPQYNCSGKGNQQQVTFSGVCAQNYSAPRNFVDKSWHRMSGYQTEQECLQAATSAGGSTSTYSSSPTSIF